mmetsp:Transcript_10479/g.20246  ORF Transcript_10479/g.20246 Transcript_10479/m.20246 type:complete len:99 (+) Transcript_10479:204-500(+)
MKFGEMLLVMLLTVLGMRTIGYLFYPDGNNGQHQPSSLSEIDATIDPDTPERLLRQRLVAEISRNIKLEKEIREMKGTLNKKATKRSSQLLGESNGVV